MKMKMKLIRIKTTEREYAIPESRYSELPCFRIEDGAPAQTSFTYEELRYMINHDLAEVVGEVELALKLTRSA